MDTRLSSFTHFGL